MAKGYVAMQTLLKEGKKKERGKKFHLWKPFYSCQKTARLVRLDLVCSCLQFLGCFQVLLKNNYSKL